MSTSTRVAVLLGEGIECEKESERAFGQLGYQVSRLRIQDILRSVDQSLANLKAGDWIFLPGGFSFADHFGSGRLLSFALERTRFLEACLERSLNLMGVCNGFQVLCESGLFGKDVSLCSNQVAGRSPGFVDRWVECEGLSFVQGEKFLLPVRHGEGRIVREASRWDSGVEPFLRYTDSFFENGSVDRVAGLIRKVGASRILGLMPHPEIALRPSDAPDTLIVEWPSEKRESLLQPVGDGARLLKSILQNLS